MKGLSAPEVADRLQEQWSLVSEGGRRTLFWNWTDDAIRKALPEMCDRFRCSDSGAQLRLLPPIKNEAALVRADAVLRRVAKELPDKNIDLFVCMSSIGAFLTKAQFDIYEACFNLIMTSRWHFGDDRLVPLMERQIAALLPGAC